MVFGEVGGEATIGTVVAGGMKRFFFGSRRRRDGRDQDPSDASRLLTGDPRQDEHSLRILLETIAGVTLSTDLDGVLADIVDRALQVTQAERGLLLLGDAPEDLVVRTARDRQGRDLGREVRYSRSSVRRCVEESRPVRAVVQSDEEALELGRSVYDLKLRAVMCAPLVVKDRTLGAIYVDSRAARREFSSRDLALFAALSAQLAIAVENARLHRDSLEKARLEKDVEIARTIQRRLLSPVPRDVAGLDIAVRYIPCRAASGDTYDFIRTDGDELTVAIGDVTGHGVGAALVSHSAQSALRSYVELISDPREVMQRLNNRMCESVEIGNFISLLLVILDPADRTMRWVNAGHPELLHVTRGGVIAHGASGVALGLVKDAEFELGGPVTLASGDVLFLYTDGVEETLNPAREPFGEERLTKVLERVRSQAAQGVLDAVACAIEAHRRGAPLADDVTMIAVKVP